MLTGPPHGRCLLRLRHDAGLVLAALDRITDGDRQSWFDEWTAMAADPAAPGHEAVGRGHLRTARWALLAAAEYYAKSLVVVDALADQSVLMPAFREHLRCWDAVVDASQDRFVGMQVPYEGTTLPGFLLRPDATGAARPRMARTLAFRSRPYGQSDWFDLFTQAQGANFHCQPTGRQLTHTQMLDWLAEHLPVRPA